jgi:hypothetical protein
LLLPRHADLLLRKSTGGRYCPIRRPLLLPIFDATAYFVLISYRSSHAIFFAAIASFLSHY